MSVSVTTARVFMSRKTTIQKYMREKERSEGEGGIKRKRDKCVAGFDVCVCVSASFPAMGEWVFLSGGQSCEQMDC